VIPPGGGSFGYTAQIHNNEGFAVTFDAWTMAQLPNGSNYGPIINRTVTLGAGGSLSRAMNQFVPASAPAGNYIYYGKVGVVPDMVWNQDSFPFSKSGATGNGLGNWYLMGWDASATQGGISLNGYHLSQNYPNPFNPTTTIEFSLPIASNVKLVIYNVLGKEIETLVSGWFQEGEHKVEFNAKNLPSGVYFYRLQAEGFEEMKKMVLIK
jgi:hypothetical protein